MLRCRSRRCIEADASARQVDAGGLLALVASGEVPLRLGQFSPLVRVSQDPAIMVVRAASPIHAFDDLIAQRAELRFLRQPLERLRPPLGGAQPLRARQPDEQRAEPLSVGRRHRHVRARAAEDDEVEPGAGAVDVEGQPEMIAELIDRADAAIGEPIRFEATAFG